MERGKIPWRKQRLGLVLQDMKEAEWEGNVGHGISVGMNFGSPAFLLSVLKTLLEDMIDL